MNIKDIIFQFHLKGYGWAESRLSISGQNAGFEVSYLCDPIYDLLQGLLSITPEYAAQNFDTKKSESECSFLWRGEPKSYLWNFEVLEKEKLKIRITSSDEYCGGQYTMDQMKTPPPDEKIEMDVTCEFHSFLKTVIWEFDRLIKDYGLVRIDDSWDHSSEGSFPIAAFLKLKHKVLYGSRYPWAEETEKVSCRLKSDLELLLIEMPASM